MPLDNPLRGKRVLITRALHQVEELALKLQAYGAKTIAVPLLSIAPPDSWEAFDNAYRNLDQYNWLIFASSNAVETALERAKAISANKDIALQKIACIGASTASCLEDNGLKATFVPSQFVAESFTKEFPIAQTQTAQNSNSTNKILWTKTTIGRNTIKDELEKKGWQVDVVHSYKTEGPANPKVCAAKLKALLQNNELDIITLTSSEAARRLEEAILIAINDNQQGQEKEKTQELEQKLKMERLLSQVKLAVIGPETAKTCKSLFKRVDIEAAKYNIDGLLDAILRYYS